MRQTESQSDSEGEETLQHAMSVGYAYLNQRERTVAQMRRRLEREGIDPRTLVTAIGTLIDQGYLDDARYVRLFVSDRRELDGWGRERIGRVLAERGIERELIEPALEADQPPQAELDRALVLLRRRFPDPPRERRERNRALGMLLRKGYDPELALDALAAHARGLETA